MIHLTPRADGHIRAMLARRNKGETALRIGVKGGGCSGFEYTFGWETTPRPTDAVFEGPGGARLVVDPKSLRLLDGTTVDYDTSLLTREFVLDNPNARSTCGCGTSFSASLQDQRS